MPCQLTPAQERQWREEGFVVVPGILSAKEAAAHVEELAQPPTEAAAAAGLNRHAVDPSFGTLATHEAVLDIVRQLLAEPAEPPRILQTMYLNKTSDDSVSRLGIALHQDTHYIPNEPNTLLACWIALTDTDESNGGLFVVPGSHRGPLLAEDITIDEANHLAWEMVHKMRERDGTEWEQPFHSVDVTAAGFDESEAVALRVPAGSAVFFSGMTVHGSYANNSAEPRRAFATHYMDGGSWVSRCDLQSHLSTDEVAAGLLLAAAKL
jgi:phytanoyl-CoA hydroxylase